jgi:signal transduction histidine kinase
MEPVEVHSVLLRSKTDDLGLAAATEWQARDLQVRSGVSCVVRVSEEDLPLSRDQASAVSHLSGKLKLTNVVRHAQAKKVPYAREFCHCRSAPKPSLHQSPA